MKYPLLVLFFCLPQGLFAFQPRSTMYVGFGNYTIATEDATLRGTETNLGLKVFYDPNFAYFAALGMGNSEGTWESYDQSTETTISQSQVEVSGGMEYRNKISDSPAITPFVGAGIKIQQYRYDFDFPNSEIGTTNGVGFGPLAHVGLRLGLGKHFTIIPKYYFSAISVKGEKESEVIVSTGFQIALVGSF